MGSRWWEKNVSRKAVRFTILSLAGIVLFVVLLQSSKMMMTAAQAKGAAAPGFSRPLAKVS
jgi:hypothetical protein